MFNWKIKSDSKKDQWNIGVGGPSIDTDILESTQAN